MAYFRSRRGSAASRLAPVKRDRMEPEPPILSLVLALPHLPPVQCHAGQLALATRTPLLTPALPPLPPVQCHAGQLALATRTRLLTRVLTPPACAAPPRPGPGP